MKISQYGLLGRRLSHSISPKIHKKIFELTNYKNAQYEIMEIEPSEVETTLKTIKQNMKGVNVTIPYKKTVIPHLTFISQEAKQIGAINTILTYKDNLYGFNTDYFGFAKMLYHHNINITNKVVVVIGSGGSSKAVTTYLTSNKAKQVYVVTRDKTDKLLQPNLTLINYENLKNIKGDVLINTTPIGMYPNIDETPIDSTTIQNYNVLVDLIYNPIQTKFLSIGEKLNKKTCGGLYMLVAQAVKSQEIWQNKSINNGVINIIYDYFKHEGL